ncbi:hypothetical protein D516_2071 [Rhodobacter sp. AKP1]|nr:hypothetical protein D516_2071 [Rhodobacter sp. AKP1]
MRAGPPPRPALGGRALTALQRAGATYQTAACPRPAHVAQSQTSGRLPDLPIGSETSSIEGETRCLPAEPPLSEPLPWRPRRS